MPTYYTFEREVRVDEYYIVEDPERGEEVLGWVAALESRCTCQLEKNTFPKVLREATASEIARWKQRREREAEYLIICREKVKKHKLDMKVSRCRIDNVNSKIVFNFTADQRVDFRELVRDLAGALRSRIELWQIGVRDEAKRIDGVDICGNQLCCSAWMSKFDPVTIKHARDQDIMRAPAKLAGLCGRLRCCLTFEHEMYQEIRKEALADAGKQKQGEKPKRDWQTYESDAAHDDADPKVGVCDSASEGELVGAGVGSQESNGASRSKNARNGRGQDSRRSGDRDRNRGRGPGGGGGGDRGGGRGRSDNRRPQPKGRANDERAPKRKPRTNDSTQPRDSRPDQGERDNGSRNNGPSKRGRGGRSRKRKPNSDNSQ